MSYQHASQYGLDSEPAGNWRMRGVCRDMDAEQFFAEEGARTRHAKQYCRFCPVRVECLEDALVAEAGRSASNRYGVFGGTVPRERWQIDLCRSGRCRHPEHRRDDDYARLIAEVIDLAGRGHTDAEIGKAVRRSVDSVRALRKANEIPAGWRVVAKR